MTSARAVDISTGEITELSAGDQQRLFGPFEAPEEFELAITGASGLEGSADLALGQDVEIVIRGHVRKITQEIRTKPEKEGGAEYLVRIAAVKASGASVSKGGR